MSFWLDDRTARSVISYWHDNVVCLSVTLCFVTKRYTPEQKCLNKWIGSASILQRSTHTPTLSPQTLHVLNHRPWCYLANILKTYCKQANRQNFHVSDSHRQQVERLYETMHCDRLGILVILGAEPNVERANAKTFWHRMMTKLTDRQTDRMSYYTRSLRSVVGVKSLLCKFNCSTRRKSYIFKFDRLDLGLRDVSGKCLTKSSRGHLTCHTVTRLLEI